MSLPLRGRGWKSVKNEVLLTAFASLPCGAWGWKCKGVQKAVGKQRPLLCGGAWIAMYAAGRYGGTAERNHMTVRPDSENNLPVSSGAGKDKRLEDKG